jgi:hypothetical protein
MLGRYAPKRIDRRIKVDSFALVCSSSPVWICLVAAEEGVSGCVSSNWQR